jgi:hypothetical protein
VRASAAIVLANLAEYDDRVVPSLAQRLRGDSSANVRIICGQALAQTGRLEALKALESVEMDPDPYTRLPLVRALERLRRRIEAAQEDNIENFLSQQIHEKLQALNLPGEALKSGTLASAGTEPADRQNEKSEVSTRPPGISPGFLEEFASNHLALVFEATRTASFGRKNAQKSTTWCILCSDGSQTYALVHVDQLPFTSEKRKTDLSRLTATFQPDKGGFAGSRLGFLGADPRIFVIPMERTEASQYGKKIYPIATEPSRHYEVVIASTRADSYGECKIQADMGMAGHFKIDRDSLHSFGGLFNPSRGDLVFTKEGKLLGMMINDDYYALLNNSTTVEEVQLGDATARQPTGKILSQVYDRILKMPTKLQ